jgi:hypothetical protein
MYASQKPSKKGRPRSTGIAEIIDKTAYVCIAKAIQKR